MHLNVGATSHKIEEEEEVVHQHVLQKEKQIQL